MLRLTVNLVTLLYYCVIFLINTYCIFCLIN